MTLTYTYRKTSKPRGLYTTSKHIKGSHSSLFLYDVNYMRKSIYNTVICVQFYKLFMALTYSRSKFSRPSALYNARIHVKGSHCNLDLSGINYRCKSIYYIVIKKIILKRRNWIEGYQDGSCFHLFVWISLAILNHKH